MADHDHDDVVIIAGQQPESFEEPPSGPRRRLAVVVVGMAVVVAIGLFVLLGGNAESPEESASPSDPVAEQTPAPTRTPTVEPNSANDQDDDTASDDSDDSDETGAVRPTPTAVVPLESGESTFVRLGQELALGEPVGLALAVAFDDTLVITNLDTGARIEQPAPPGLFRELPQDESFVITESAVVFVTSPRSNAGAEIRWAPIGSQEPLGELGVGFGVFRDPDADAIWIIDGTDRFIPPFFARRVDFAGGAATVTAQHELVNWPVGATADGLLFGSGGRIFVAGDDTIDDLGAGEPLATAPNGYLARICDEGPCALETRRIDGTTSGANPDAPLGAIIASVLGPTLSGASDTLAVYNTFGNSAEVLLVDLATGQPFDPDTGQVVTFHWGPTGRWLLAVNANEVASIIDNEQRVTRQLDLTPDTTVPTRPVVELIPSAGLPFPR